MRNLAIALLLGLAVGSTATAADGWRVFGSGNDGGAYTSNADATGTIRNPNDLAFRVRGEGPFIVTWTASCNSTTRQTRPHRPLQDRPGADVHAVGRG